MRTWRSVSATFSSVSAAAAAQRVDGLAEPVGEHVEHRDPRSPEPIAGAAADYRAAESRRLAPLYNESAHSGSRSSWADFSSSCSIWWPRRLPCTRRGARPRAPPSTSPRSISRPPRSPRTRRWLAGHARARGGLSLGLADSASLMGLAIGAGGFLAVFAPRFRTVAAVCLGLAALLAAGTGSLPAQQEIAAARMAARRARGARDGLSGHVRDRCRPRRAARAAGRRAARRPHRAAGSRRCRRSRASNARCSR